MRHFFLAKIFVDFARYCRSCPGHWKNTPKGKVAKALLISNQPMGEPSRIVAVYIVGLFPMTESKPWYTLVAFGQATMFLEAISTVERAIYGHRKSEPG